MQKKLTLFLVSFIFIAAISNAQTVILPANTISIHNDTTITLAPGGGIDKNYHICPGADVYFTGVSTYLMRFYIESTGSVELDPSFTFFVVAEVFMKQNSTFDFNNKLGSIVDTLMADFPCNLIDTGTSVTNLIAAPNLVFDYSLLPNGVNPCALPTGMSDMNAKQNIIIQNPFDDAIVINTGVLKPNTRFALYSATGQLLFRRVISNTNERIPAFNLPGGFYTYVMYSEGMPVQRGKLLKR